MEAILAKARATWAEGACEPEQILANGDKIVALAHVRVRLKDSTEWLEGRLGDAFIIENGLVRTWITFNEPRQALEWAGLEASNS
jgi:hypothetical protein